MGVALCATVSALSSKERNICSVLPKDSIILKQGSCTDWIKCPSSSQLEHYEEGTCLPGLFFDKDESKCRPEKDVKCPFKSSTNKSDICLYENDGTFLADPDSCYNFVYCNQTIAYTHPCPGYLVFDPHKRQCVYFDQYICLKKETVETHEDCLVIRDSKAFADRVSCVKYHTCENGRLVNYTCSEGEAFDRVQGYCRKIREAECFLDEGETHDKNAICGTLSNKKVGFISDGKTCSGYYHCKDLRNDVDRNPIWSKCRDGRFFDGLTLSCRDRTSVSCAFDRCEGMGNSFANIAGNCSQYAVCKNSARIDFGKCSDGYYFDEKSQGCTKELIKYVACS